LPFSHELIAFCWTGVGNAYWQDLYVYVAFLVTYAVSVAWFDTPTTSGSTVAVRGFSKRSSCVLYYGTHMMS
jgi:hypothetical protein